MRDGIYPDVFIKYNKISWGMAHGHRFTVNKEEMALLIMNLVVMQL